MSGERSVTDRFMNHKKRIAGAILAFAIAVPGVAYADSTEAHEHISTSAVGAAAIDSTPSHVDANKESTRISDKNPNPSGLRVHYGNLAIAGHNGHWKQVMVHDFNDPLAKGKGFPSGKYSQDLTTYAPDTRDNFGKALYDPHAVTISGGMLQIHAGYKNGENRCAEFNAKQAYVTNRESIRMRVVGVKRGYGYIDELWAKPNGRKAQWPKDGETTFVEGALDGNVGAHAHFARAQGGQDNFMSTLNFNNWHTYTMERMWQNKTASHPGRHIEDFQIDGHVIGVSTKFVPTVPMRDTIACGQAGGEKLTKESKATIQIDWIDEYEQVK